MGTTPVVIARRVECLAKVFTAVLTDVFTQNETIWRAVVSFAAKSGLRPHRGRRNETTRQKLAKENLMEEIMFLAKEGPFLI